VAPHFAARLTWGAALSTLSLLAALGVGTPTVSASGCYMVTTSKGTMTAALVDPTSPVTGTVMPTGCDIGVYFGPGTTGSVVDATITGFVEYGVFNDGGTVSVRDSTITMIGNTPFNGVQYGIGVYFVNPHMNNAAWPSSPARGTISNNTIAQYQKGGITVNGLGSAAVVTDNMVEGLGPVPFIAQNGIQFGFGATPLAVQGNTVHGNLYTEGYAPPGNVATGILYYQADTGDASTGAIVGALASENHVYDNQADIVVVR
jgi:hypothetical protein